jgi:hypothetical protein
MTEVGIGLHVDESAIDEELPVTFHEEGGSQSFGGFLHLWVGEGEP